MLLWLVIASAAITELGLLISGHSLNYWESLLWPFIVICIARGAIYREDSL